jgi:hypothetical protein
MRKQKQFCTSGSVWCTNEPLITLMALVIMNTRGRFGSKEFERSWRDDGTEVNDLI